MMYSNNNIQIKRFLFPEIEEVNSFLISCLTTKDALLIDAGSVSDDLSIYIEEHRLNLKYLFITHNHYDHVSGVDSLKNSFANLNLINRDLSYALTDDDDSFQFGASECKFHYLPGHTDDMMVLYLNGHLFTGDVLFAGSVGGTHDQINYQLQIDQIRKVIFSYPDDTIIHPGHGPDSTIALEKLYNPFLSI